MSDPAFAAASLPDGSLTLEEVPRRKEAVYLLDFDGVVAAGVEDAIYKLPSQPGEEAVLRDFARRFAIRCEAMELRYQRHLLFQEAARRMGLPIQPGPGIALARWAAAEARCFVLTARSGWSAAERARIFIAENMVPPIEMYQVGRTQKIGQVALVCSEFKESKVYYVEDSKKHLSDAALLRHENLSLAYSDPGVSMDQALELYRGVMATERHGVTGREP